MEIGIWNIVDFRERGGYRRRVEWVGRGLYRRSYELKVYIWISR